MMDADLLLAIELQERYDREQDSGEKAASSHVPAAAQPQLMAVVDPSWELLDPSPNIHELFLQFNAMFFWGKLVGVEVKWSHRMTLCAGVCSYEGRGGLCSIRLSKPLLSLRPRKDLVETLLHEMIHALLFVTDNNKDHDGHGPEFHKHMNRINGLTGSKISVYHSFHDEVEEYRKHWWQCNGPCRQRPPYFGYVKRAMNRAPSKLDPWWAEHQRSCGGTYVKVKEPEKKTTGKDKKKEEVLPANIPEGKGKSEGGDLRTFFPFSGNGYRLGDPSQVSKTVKVPPFSNNALTNSKKPVQAASALFSVTNKSINPRPNLPGASFSVTNKSSDPRPNLPGASFSVTNKSSDPRPNLPGASFSVTNKSSDPRPNLPGASFSITNKSSDPRPNLPGASFSITNKSSDPRPNLPSAWSSITNKSSDPRPNLPSAWSSVTNKSSDPRPNLPGASFSITNKSSDPRPNLPGASFSIINKSSDPRPNLPSVLSSVTNKSINPRPNLSSAWSSVTNKSINPRPKVSVANTKAFKNLNGSPIRLPVHGRNVSKPSGSKLGTLDGFTQKRLSFVVPSSSQGAPSTSPGSSQDESHDRPPKRIRLDNATSKEHFPGSNSFREETVIVLDGSSSSNHNNQSKTVNCPVCGAKVAEAKINEHLDNCLNS